MDHCIVAHKNTEALYCSTANDDDKIHFIRFTPVKPSTAVSIHLFIDTNICLVIIVHTGAGSGAAVANTYWINLKLYFEYDWLDCFSPIFASPTEKSFPRLGLFTFSK